MRRDRGGGSTRFCLPVALVLAFIHKHFFSKLRISRGIRAIFKGPSPYLQKMDRSMVSHISFFPKSVQRQPQDVIE